MKRVELRVPSTADLPGLWAVSQPSPCLLLSLPARLLGFTSPSLWMLSVCLAETEKHKGDLYFDPNRLTIRLLKALFCSVSLLRHPLFEDSIYWCLIAVSCLQVLTSSRRRSASLLGSNSLRRYRAEWPSSLGSRPTTSDSTCAITEETRHMWRDSSLDHDPHRLFWSSFMQTCSGPSPPDIVSGPPYLMVPPVLDSSSVLSNPLIRNMSQFHGTILLQWMFPYVAPQQTAFPDISNWWFDTCVP